jgi:Spy/CpxP family protein refolding chaperone
MSRTVVAKLIVAASLLVSPIAASATTTVGAQPTAAAAKNADAGEKKICKQLPSSSSRLPQRVCLTEKQWKQVDSDSQ